jgi:hypothetical protein
MKNENKADIQRVEFRDTDNSNAKYLTALNLSLEYSGKQFVNRHGIEVTLVIQNTAASDISIVNPLELLQIVILDSQGYPASVPIGAPPRILINQRGDYTQRLPYQVKNTQRRNDKTKTDEGFDYSTEEITLPGNSTTHFSLVIDKLNVQRPGGQTSSTAFAPPPPDKYSANFILPVISHQGEYAYRQCETGNVVIRYYEKRGCLAAIQAFFRRLFGGK